MALLTGLLALALSCLLPGVTPQASLVDPPHRSALWRHQHPTPINFNYAGLNCGGFRRQWMEAKGRCGTCGDPYYSERENEAGGKFATGRVVRSYRQGELISVTVRLDRPRQGYFEFRLCPQDDPLTPVDPACLQRYLLEVVDLCHPGTRRYYPGHKCGEIKLLVQLPSDVSCQHCVLQWTYRTGGWGCAKDGVCGVGEGKTETYVNCADVSISPRGQGSLEREEATWTAQWSSFVRGYFAQAPQVLNSSSTGSFGTSGISASGAFLCVPTGAYVDVPGMDEWCRVNCPGFCPGTHCSCSKK